MHGLHGPWACAVLTCQKTRGSLIQIPPMWRGASHACEYSLATRTLLVACLGLISSASCTSQHRIAARRSLVASLMNDSCLNHRLCGRPQTFSWVLWQACCFGFPNGLSRASSMPSWSGPAMFGFFVFAAIDATLNWGLPVFHV